MSHPLVVNIKSGAEYDVYIGRAVPRRGLRASPWANPFRIGDDGDRQQVIDYYRNWVRYNRDERAIWIREHVHELRGKRLGCFCSPLACHGDLLAKWAEEGMT